MLTLEEALRDATTFKEQPCRCAEFPDAYVFWTPKDLEENQDCEKDDVFVLRKDGLFMSGCEYFNMTSDSLRIELNHLEELPVEKTLYHHVTPFLYKKIDKQV